MHSRLACGESNRPRLLNYFDAHQPYTRHRPSGAPNTRATYRAASHSTPIDRVLGVARAGSPRPDARHRCVRPWRAVCLGNNGHAHSISTRSAPLFIRLPGRVPGISGTACAAPRSRATIMDLPLTAPLPGSRRDTWTGSASPARCWPSYGEKHREPLSDVPRRHGDVARRSLAADPERGRPI
jgi:hypothetical protein